jgi:hypothetical protein
MTPVDSNRPPSYPWLDDGVTPIAARRAACNARRAETISPEVRAAAAARQCIHFFPRVSGAPSAKAN